MHEPFVRFLRVGVCPQILWPEMQLAHIFKTVNMYEFDADVLCVTVHVCTVKIPQQFVSPFSARRQLKLSHAKFQTHYIIFVALFTLHVLYTVGIDDQPFHTLNVLPLIYPGIRANHGE